jgi:Tfp pilus assembly PilM family ATPase
MIGIGYDIGSSFVKAALVEVKTGNSIALARVPEVEIPMEAHYSRAGLNKTPIYGGNTFAKPPKNF